MDSHAKNVMLSPRGLHKMIYSPGNLGISASRTILSKTWAHTGGGVALKFSRHPIARIGSCRRQSLVDATANKSHNTTPRLRCVAYHESSSGPQNHNSSSLAGRAW